MAASLESPPRPRPRSAPGPSRPASGPGPPPPRRVRGTASSHATAAGTVTPHPPRSTPAAECVTVFQPHDNPDLSAVLPLMQCHVREQLCSLTAPLVPSSPPQWRQLSPHNTSAPRLVPMTARSIAHPPTLAAHSPCRVSRDIHPHGVPCHRRWVTATPMSNARLSTAPLGEGVATRRS